MAAPSLARKGHDTQNRQEPRGRSRPSPGGKVPEGRMRNAGVSLISQEPFQAYSTAGYWAVGLLSVFCNCGEWQPGLRPKIDSKKRSLGIPHRHLAARIPLPTRLRRATFPPGEGSAPAGAGPVLVLRTVAAWRQGTGLPRRKAPRNDRDRMRKAAPGFRSGFVAHNQEGFSINRTFSCSYGQLQTSASASGWG